MAEFSDTANCNPNDNSTGHQIIRQFRSTSYKFGRKLELTNLVSGKLAPVRVIVCWEFNGKIKSVSFESLIEGK
jgi:hypothetical protein